MKKILEKIGAFFAVNNEVNENTVMGVIVLVYIFTMYAFGNIETDAELWTWLGFDSLFWGLNLKK
jgi:hypothetical protein